MTENNNRSLVLKPSGAIALRSNPDSLMARMTLGVLAEVRAGNVVAAEQRFRLGKYDFREPDYLQIMSWAVELGLTAEVVLERLEAGKYPNYFTAGEEIIFEVTDGSMVSLTIDLGMLPIAFADWQVGLTIKRIGLIRSLITSFPLKPVSLYLQLPSLRRLFCESIIGGLQSLDLSNLPALNCLVCGGNGLTELDLSNQLELTELWCDCIELTELDLSNLPELTELRCDFNQLTELDLSNMPELTGLRCDFNRLTELDLSNQPMIKWLNCRENQLTKLDLSNQPMLKWLRCDNNQLTELDLSNLPELTAKNVDADPGVKIIRRQACA